MKIAITGSLGNISKSLVKLLAAKGHNVTVISRSSDKKSEIEKLGADAAIGDNSDIDFMADTFSGQDVVYLMIPPNLQADDLTRYISVTGDRYAQAIKKSGVRRVVALSSMGAHLPLGNGPLSALKLAEKQYDDLHDVDITYLRPGGFFTNYLSQIGVIKHAGIAGDNTSPQSRFLITHPADIADEAADAILNPISGKSVRYVVSEEIKNDEIASLLGKAIGKPDLQWIQFPNEDYKNALLQNGFSPSAAQAFVEMGDAFREGRAFAEADANPDKIVRGKRRFADFANEVFATAFGG